MACILCLDITEKIRISYVLSAAALVSAYSLTGSDMLPAVAAFRQLLMTLVAWLSFDGTPGAQPTHPSARSSAAQSSHCLPIGQHCKVPQESLETARKERAEHKKRNKVGLHQSFVMRRRRVMHRSLLSKRTFPSSSAVVFCELQ